jgi:hypothetical protein
VGLGCQHCLLRRRSRRSKQRSERTLIGDDRAIRQLIRKDDTEGAVWCGMASPQHLSADDLTRLFRSLCCGPAVLSRALDTPLGSVGSLLPAGVCDRALWRLPGQDLHLLDQRVFEDAPSRQSYQAPTDLDLARVLGNRHGQVAIADCIQPTSMCLAQVATQPFVVQAKSSFMVI